MCLVDEGPFKYQENNKNLDIQKMWKIFCVYWLIEWVPATRECRVFISTHRYFAVEFPNLSKKSKSLEKMLNSSQMKHKKVRSTFLRQTKGFSNSWWKCKQICIVMRYNQYKILFSSIIINLWSLHWKQKRKVVCCNVFFFFAKQSTFINSIKLFIVHLMKL